MVGRISPAPATKDVHMLIRRTCEYVTSHGKRDFVDVNKLRTLKYGDYPGLSGWTLSNQESLKTENHSWLWFEGDMTKEEWSEG